MRLAFLGTGTFGLPTLRRVIASRHTLVALITGPDRLTPSGKPIPHLMKEAAVAAGVRVLQPPKVNDASALDELRSLAADLFVVADYGQILSRGLLDIPRLGAINLHGSLLPRHRGAAPIQHAVLHGDTVTGVTIFQIEPKLDAGPVLGMVSTPIGSTETSADIEARLAELSVPLTLELLDQLEVGTTTVIHQDTSLATKAPKLTKEMGRIDWSKPGHAIGCHVRAMQPWPMASSHLHIPGREPLRVIVLAGEPRSCPADQESLTAGMVLQTLGEELHIRCGDGAFAITRLLPVGKKPMTTAEFQRGYHATTGARMQNVG